MADIFVAYAKNDLRRARKLVAALRDRGWTVWFDRKVASTKAAEAQNREEIEKAKVVLTLWSRHAAQDQDVARFTKYAMQVNALVSVQLDRARVPTDFTSVKPINLTGWRGQPKHRGFDQMVRTIEFYLEAEPQRDGVRLAAPPKRPSKSNRRNGASAWTEQALLLRLVIAGLFAAYALMPDTPLFRPFFEALGGTDLVFLSPDATRGLIDYPTWAYHGAVILMVLSAALLLLGYVTRLAALIMLGLAGALFFAASIILQDYMSLLPTFAPLFAGLALLFLFGAGKTSLDAVAPRS